MLLIAKNIFKNKCLIINFYNNKMNILTSRLPALKFIAMFGTAHLGFTLLSNVLHLVKILDEQSKRHVNPIIHVERHQIKNIIYRRWYAKTQVHYSLISKGQSNLKLV